MRAYIRLNITTEGQTEHRFVSDVLYPHLAPLNIHCQMRSVLTSRQYRKRGGLVSYAKAKEDMVRWMKEDRSPDARFTTMFDYYALPNDFPGYKEAAKLNSPYDKVNLIQQCVEEDVNDHRFYAYIQLHEFEALLYTNPDALLLEYQDRQREIELLTGVTQKALTFLNGKAQIC